MLACGCGAYQFDTGRSEPVKVARARDSAERIDRWVHLAKTTRGDDDVRTIRQPSHTGERGPSTSHTTHPIASAFSGTGYAIQ